MSARARLFLALFLFFTSQLLTPRLVVAQGTRAPAPAPVAAPVPTPRPAPSQTQNQNSLNTTIIMTRKPAPPTQSVWWKWVPTFTTTPVAPPNQQTVADVSASPQAAAPCTWCIENLRKSVTQQLKAGRDLVASLLPTQTTPTQAAPSPPAVTECGVLHLLTCLTDAYSFVTGGYTRLESIVMKHVNRPRATSRTARAKGAPAVLSGDRTKGMCKQATNDFLVEAGLLCERIPGDHAFEAKGYLEDKLHLPNIESSIRRDPQGRIDPSTIPLNTILVYEDTRPAGRTRSGAAIPRSGHIEYKLSPEKYCSDFTSKFPISISNPQRRLIGAYRAPGCKK